MLIHQPTNHERVVWYGGDSTQLHYEQFIDGDWKQLSVKTLMEFPHSVKEFKRQVEEFYQCPTDDF